MVKLVIQVKGTDKLNLEETGREIAKRGLNYTTQDLLRNLIENSPVDTGLLRSWALTLNEDLKKEIHTPAVYASWVNDGTGLYGPMKRKITPKNASALKFTYQGQTVFAKSVKGQRGQKFVEKSIAATESKLDSLFIRAATEVQS